MLSKEKRRGFLLALSSPSGAGKTTLAKRLLQHTDLQLSISVTTRQPRPKEKDGVDYHFRTIEQFHRLKETGQFLESAIVHGNYYGSLKAGVEEGLAQGKDFLFDVDVQGVERIKACLGKDVVCVFVLPPSLETLKQRLFLRGQDSSSAVETRLQNAEQEIKAYKMYDYIVVNDDVEEAAEALKAIYHAETLSTKRGFCLQSHE